MSDNPSKGRAAVKFTFWTALAAALFAYVGHQHTTGQLAAWYYHRAAIRGYAVDADTFAAATKDAPALLAIEQTDRIDGPVAVRVEKGDRLPANANGVIADDVLKTGRRATLAGGHVRVTIPWEVQQSKGFKYKDTFEHKGIETYPWAGLWNVLIVIGLGLALGFMAEGFTDLLGIRVERIRHHEGH